MKPFKIGSQVRVTAIAEVGYFDGRNRTVSRIAVEPFYAEVIGKAVKMLGEYRPAKGGGFYSFEDYDEASLKVEGSVTLWEVRTGMTNKPILVHDDDLEESVWEFKKLPHRGSRPKRIESEEVLNAADSP